MSQSPPKTPPEIKEELKRQQVFYNGSVSSRNTTNESPQDQAAHARLREIWSQFGGDTANLPPRDPNRTLEEQLVAERNAFAALRCFINVEELMNKLGISQAQRDFPGGTHEQQLFLERMLASKSSVLALGKPCDACMAGSEPWTCQHNLPRDPMDKVIAVAQTNIKPGPGSLFFPAGERLARAVQPCAACKAGPEPWKCEHVEDDDIPPLVPDSEDDELPPLIPYHADGVTRELPDDDGVKWVVRDPKQ